MILTSLLGLITFDGRRVICWFTCNCYSNRLWPTSYLAYIKQELGVSINNQTQMIRTNELLEQLMSSGIDEKISIFHTYENLVKTWNNKDLTNPVYSQQKSMSDKIKADVRAVSKLASRMTSDQKEVSHGVLRRIMTALIEKGFEDEADQIEDAIATIFAS